MPICAAALGFPTFSSQASQLPLPGTQQLPGFACEVAPPDLNCRSLPPFCQSTRKPTWRVLQALWAVSGLSQLHLYAS